MLNQFVTFKLRGVTPIYPPAMPNQTIKIRTVMRHNFVIQIRFHLVTVGHGIGSFLSAGSDDLPPPATPTTDSRFELVM